MLPEKFVAQVRREGVSYERNLSRLASSWEFGDLRGLRRRRCCNAAIIWRRSRMQHITDISACYLGTHGWQTELTHMARFGVLGRSARRQNREAHQKSVLAPPWLHVWPDSTRMAYYCGQQGHRSCYVQMGVGSGSRYRRSRARGCTASPRRRKPRSSRGCTVARTTCPCTRSPLRSTSYCPDRTPSSIPRAHGTPRAGPHSCALPWGPCVPSVGSRRIARKGTHARRPS